MADIFVKALNISITASYLVLAVLLLRLILKKAPKWSVCLLWGLVALRLVMPFSLESELSLIPSANTVLVSDTADVPFEINTGVDTVDTQINDIITENKDSINEVNQSINSSFAEVEDNPNPPSDNKTDTHQQDSNPAEKTKISIFTVLGFVWILGVLVMLVYSAVSFLIIRIKVKVCLHYRDNIYYCDSIDTSFILGIFSPKIYIQSGMSQENTDYVIKHERAHLKRCDHLLKPFAFLLLSAHWFNPLIWVAYILLCRDIESACDERVIEDENITDILGYSSALLDCGTKHKKLIACPVAFGEVSVKSRIKSVLKYKRPADWLAALSVVLAVVVGVGFLTNPKEKVNALTNESNNVSSFEEMVENIVSDPQGDDAVAEDKKAEEVTPSHEDTTSQENTTVTDDTFGTNSESSFVKDDAPTKLPVQNSSSSSESSTIPSEIIQIPSRNDSEEFLIDLGKLSVSDDFVCYEYPIEASPLDWFVDGDYVHMIFSRTNKYALVDTNTGTVTEKSLPGDVDQMHCFGDEIWISFPVLKCIKIYDKQTFVLKKTMDFDYEISAFDIYKDFLIFAEGNSLVSVYKYNMRTGDIVKLEDSNKKRFSSPDILVNEENGLLYISESGNTGCGIYCYDIESLSLKSYYLKSDYGYTNWDKRSFLNDGYVYWGEFRFDALDISRVNAQYASGYPSSMCQVGGNFVVTNNGIFSKDNSENICDLEDFPSADAVVITRSGNILIADYKYLYITKNQ